MVILACPLHQPEASTKLKLQGLVRYKDMQNKKYFITHHPQQIVNVGIGLGLGNVSPGGVNEVNWIDF